MDLILKLAEEPIQRLLPTIELRPPVLLIDPADS